MRNSYMLAIGKHFQQVQCQCVGNGSVYEDIIHTGGDPIPSKSELDAVILADTREAMWQRIKDERDRRKTNGVLVTIPGETTQKWFHSDDTSRIQQIALAMMGASLPQNLQWKTLDGSYVIMTQALAMTIFQTSAYFDQMNFANAEQHRLAMLQVASPDDYDFSSGWMPTFGE